MTEAQSAQIQTQQLRGPKWVCRATCQSLECPLTESKGSGFLPPIVTTVPYWRPPTWSFWCWCWWERICVFAPECRVVIGWLSDLLCETFANSNEPPVSYLQLLTTCVSKTQFACQKSRPDYWKLECYPVINPNALGMLNMQVLPCQMVQCDRAARAVPSWCWRWCSHRTAASVLWY
jgi:hypothetical protein